jgi:hypothetical protein
MNDYPTYSTQPMGYPPMAAPPQKKSRRGLWITLGVVGGLLVVCCAGVAGLFTYATVQAAKPIAVASSFCNDLKSQTYTSAYNLLSANYQARIPEQTFVQGVQLQDQVDGTVKSCGLQSGNSTGFTFPLNNNTATLAAQVVRNKTFTEMGQKAPDLQSGDEWPQHDR